MATKLELTWLGKDNRAVIEPRIIIENKELSKIEYDAYTKNMLIHGDNLLALRSLLNNYSGKIKAIYIDPPYNTGKAFNKYDDNQEHSIWLGLMRERLEILKQLLRPDGVIFIQINDDEGCYLKVLCDEIFGRQNFETTFYVKVRHENRILREDSRYQLVIEQVHCYRRGNDYVPPRRPKEKNPNIDYKWNISIIGDYKEKITIAGYEVEVYSPSNYKIEKVNDGEGNFKQYSIRGSLITQKGSASEYYELNLKSRREIDGLGTLYKVIGMGISGDGLGYRYIMQPEKQNSKNGLYFQGKPLKNKVDKGLPYPNFYDMTDLFNNVGYEGSGYFNGGKKPEKWIEFLLKVGGVKKGDFVLDSFLGSGTTAAVCMKLGFNFIGIEMGEHAYSLCKTRLDSIISGSDNYGIEYERNNKYSYKFYELAPTLINVDALGEPIINKGYNPYMLAAAVALHEGFIYNPDPNIFWKQSKSNENAYLFVTTKHLSDLIIKEIEKQMSEDEFLLIACKSFDKSAINISDKIKIKKIPQMLLGKCEFGKDDYSLNIVNPPVYEYEEEDCDE